MWHVWIAVVCFSIAVCESSAAGLTATPELSTPENASLQQPPPKARPSQRPGAPAALSESPAPQVPQEDDEEVGEGLGIELPTGPMRVEPWAISESRSRYDSDPPPKPPVPMLTLRTKLTGERLVQMVGRGEMIVEEMVDDTGAVLKTLADYDPSELTKTYPLRAGKRMLTAGFAGLNLEARLPSREARVLSKVRGYVNVVYATKTEEIMIDNPLQYLGGYLEHPRLQELGIKIKVISPGEQAKEKYDVGGIARSPQTFAQGRVLRRLAEAPVCARASDDDSGRGRVRILRRRSRGD
jgi:hypothetical protein